MKRSKKLALCVFVVTVILIVAINISKKDSNQNEIEDTLIRLLQEDYKADKLHFGKINNEASLHKQVDGFNYGNFRAESVFAASRMNKTHLSQRQTCDEATELSYAKTGTNTTSKCVKNSALSKMIETFGIRFNKKLPMFVDQTVALWPDVLLYIPPFGFRNFEFKVERILSILKNSELPEELTRCSCKRCIVIGNGGIISDSNLGEIIDQYEVVIRLNDAPVIGYEQDVGRKTTMRLAYPETAPKAYTGYDPNALFVTTIYKEKDFDWLFHIAAKRPAKGLEFGFWKSVAKSIPKGAEQLRLLNPLLLKELSFDLIGNEVNKGKTWHNVPVIGTVAVVAMVRLCDEVDVAGFGYSLTNPNLPLHYFGRDKMRVNNLKTHNIDSEKKFLSKLVRRKIIRDLTGGILSME